MKVSFSHPLTVRDSRLCLCNHKQWIHPDASRAQTTGKRNTYYCVSALMVLKDFLQFYNDDTWQQLSH